MNSSFGESTHFTPCPPCHPVPSKVLSSETG